MKKIVVLTGVVILLNACASDFGVHKIYRGAKLPDSAVAKIHVPGDIDVVSVDEKSIVTLLSGDPTELHVLPGAHKITLRYYQIWEERNNMTKIISDPVAKSLTVQAGRTYQVEHKSPGSVNSAKTYAPNFDFTIRQIGASTSNQTGSATVETDRSSPAAVAGAASSELAAHHKADASASNRSGEKAAPRPPLEQLKYWWGQASDADRRDFHRWIQSP